MTEYINTELTTSPDTDSNTCPFFIWDGKQIWLNRCEVCKTHMFCGLDYKQEIIRW